MYGLQKRLLRGDGSPLISLILKLNLCLRGLMNSSKDCNGLKTESAHQDAMRSLYSKFFDAKSFIRVSRNNYGFPRLLNRHSIPCHAPRNGLMAPFSCSNSVFLYPKKLIT